MVCFGWASCWRFGAQTAVEPFQTLKEAAAAPLEEVKPEQKPGLKETSRTCTPQSPRSVVSSGARSPSRSTCLEAPEAIEEVPQEPTMDPFEYCPMVPVASYLTLADVVNCVYVSRAAHSSLVIGDKLLLPWLIYSKESACCPTSVIQHVSLPHVLALRFVGSRLALDELKKLHKATPEKAGFKQLTRFVAKGCHIHAHDMPFLHHVCDQGQVGLINMEKNMLTDQVVEEMVNVVLTKDTRLETLCLRWNKIGNRGACALAELVNHPTLTTLNLKTNCVGKVGAEALARMVARDGALEVLNLRAQVPRLPDSVAFSFAEALKTNGTLRRLKLRRNKITCDGAEALCEVLQSGPCSRSLEELDLQENHLKTRGGVACAALLSVNKRIDVVFAGGNTFGRGELLEALGECSLDPRLELAKAADV
jgi:hypothetical protein